LVVWRTATPLLFALIIAACDTTADDQTVRSEVTEAGDTVVVMNHGQPDPLHLDSVSVIWRSSDLENPRALLVVDDELFVADPTRLHILTRSGEYVRTVGRDGDGPGEFRSVSALGRLGTDSVAVLDTRNQRLSFIAPDGTYLGDTRVTPVVPYVNPVEGSEIVPINDGVVSPWSENVHTDRPTRTALVWRDLAADTAAVLAEWDGQQWKEFGSGIIAADRLFGPKVMVALATDGHYAIGDGLERCVTIESPEFGAPRRVCRDQARVPVSEGIRDPDLSPVKNEQRRVVLKNIIKEQEIADYLPSFDRLLFSSRGRLWVRTVAAELAEVHPYLRRFTPEREPAYRTWDVFDADGRLVGSVKTPSNFELQVVAPDRMFGFVELATGEIAIGAAGVPSEIEN
jgi:hypothetical protein